MLQPCDVVLRRLLGRAAIAVEEDDERARLALRRVEPDLLGTAADRPLLRERCQMAHTGAAAAGSRDDRAQQENAPHKGLDERPRVWIAAQVVNGLVLRRPPRGPDYDGVASE